MEEVEYLLKEWLDSYIVSKELTTNPIRKMLKSNYASYEWQSKEKDIRVDFGECSTYSYNRQSIHANRVGSYINFNLNVNENEYQLLKDLDKIVTGFARFINNHKKAFGYDYSFQLLHADENHAKDVMERLFD
jgi:hypothetical protein